jgi:hypothetical protein
MGSARSLLLRRPAVALRGAGPLFLNAICPREGCPEPGGHGRLSVDARPWTGARKSPEIEKD